MYYVSFISPAISIFKVSFILMDFLKAFKKRWPKPKLVLFFLLKDKQICQKTQENSVFIVPELVVRYYRYRYQNWTLVSVPDTETCFRSYTKCWQDFYRYYSLILIFFLQMYNLPVMLGTRPFQLTTIRLHFKKLQIFGTHFLIQMLVYQVICMKFTEINGFDLNINCGFRRFKRIKPSLSNIIFKNENLHFNKYAKSLEPIFLIQMLVYPVIVWNSSKSGVSISISSRPYNICNMAS